MDRPASASYAPRKLFHCTKECCINSYNKPKPSHRAIAVPLTAIQELKNRKVSNIPGEYSVLSLQIRHYLLDLNLYNPQDCSTFIKTFLQNNSAGKTLVKLIADNQLSKECISKVSKLFLDPQTSRAQKIEIGNLLLQQGHFNSDLTETGFHFLQWAYTNANGYFRTIFIHSKFFQSISLDDQKKWGTFIEKQIGLPLLLSLADYNIFFKGLSDETNFELARHMMKEKDHNHFFQFAQTINLNPRTTNNKNQTLAHALALASYEKEKKEILPLIRKLEKAEIPLTQPDAFGDKPATIAFNQNRNILYNILKEKGLVSKEEHEDYQKTLQVALCFSIEKINTSRIKLRGDYAQGEYKRFQASTLEFLSKPNPRVPRQINTKLKKVIEESKYEYIQGPSLNLREKEGIISLNVSDSTHHVVLIKRYGYIAFCNSGFGTRNINNRDCHAIQIYSQNYFERYLGCFKTNWEKNDSDFFEGFTPLASFIKAFQRTSNCSWRSTKLAFLALLILEFANYHKISIKRASQQDIDRIWSDALAAYETWSCKDRIQILQDYRSRPNHNHELSTKCNMKALHIAQKRIPQIEIDNLIKSGQLYSWEYCEQLFKDNPIWDFHKFMETEHYFTKRQP